MIGLGKGWVEWGYLLGDWFVGIAIVDAVDLLQG